MPFVHTQQYQWFHFKRNLQSYSEMGVRKRKPLKSGDLVMEEVARYSYDILLRQILHIAQQKNAVYSNILIPIFINPGRKHRTNFLFLLRKKSSKMDFVKMLLGLAASHLGGLAVCALYAGTWRNFLYRAIKQVCVSISNPFFSLSLL